jgi:hypothetical protein
MMGSDWRRQIAEAAKRYWGFDALRPLQAGSEEVDPTKKNCKIGLDKALAVS